MIVEASESNKVSEVEVVVSMRMDLSFKDDLVVTIAPGALEGPWTITGTLVRTNGTGPADIPLHLGTPNSNRWHNRSPTVHGESYRVRLQAKRVSQHN